MRRVLVAMLLLTGLESNGFGQTYRRRVAQRTPMQVAEFVWPMSRATSPLSSPSATFGPTVSERTGNYVFHRGVDIPAPLGTPVYAVAPGTVRLAGTYDYYSGQVVQIRHYKPGSGGSCDNGGCYYTNYMHLSNVAVKEGRNVKQGELLGHSGQRVDGKTESRPHLHFEVRDKGVYQQNCVHPLSLLPYVNRTAPKIGFGKIDVDESGAFSVTMLVTVPKTELDWKAIQLSVTDPANRRQPTLLSKTYDLLELNQRLTPRADANRHLSNPDVENVLIKPSRLVSGGKSEKRDNRHEMEIKFHSLSQLKGYRRLTFRARAIDIGNREESATKIWRVESSPTVRKTARNK